MSWGRGFPYGCCYLFFFTKEAASMTVEMSVCKMYVVVVPVYVHVYIVLVVCMYGVISF